MEAATILAYIRDCNIGNAVTAITNHGVAPVNEDTIKQARELFIPCTPKPIWTDTRSGPTSTARRPARLDHLKSGKPCGVPRTDRGRMPSGGHTYTYRPLSGTRPQPMPFALSSTTCGWGRLNGETVKDMSIVKVAPLKRHERNGSTHHGRVYTQKRGPLSHA